MLFIREAQRNDEGGEGVSMKRARVKGTHAVIAAHTFLRNIKLCSLFGISFLMKMLGSQPKWEFYVDAALVPRCIAIHVCSQASIEA